MAIKTILRHEAPATRVASLRGWPGRDLAEVDWSKAPCRQPGADPSDWEPVAEVNENSAPELRTAAQDQAIKACGNCPFKVSQACLELAVREGVTHTVRGGLAEYELREYVAAERRRRRASAGMAVAA